MVVPKLKLEKKTMDIGVIKQVADLPDMRPIELREMWRKLYPGDSPTNNKIFLVKRLT